MLGFNGIYIPDLVDIQNLKFRMIVGQMFQIEGVRDAMFLMFLMFFIVWFMPNTFELMNDYNPVLGLKKFNNEKVLKLKWKLSPLFSCLLALLTFSCLVMMAAPSEFLYFQF